MASDDEEWVRVEEDDDEEAVSGVDYGELYEFVATQIPEEEVAVVVRSNEEDQLQGISSDETREDEPRHVDRIRLSVVYPVVSDIVFHFFEKGVPLYLRNARVAVRVLMNRVSRTTAKQPCSGKEFTCIVTCLLTIYRKFLDTKSTPSRETMDKTINDTIMAQVNV